MSAEEVQELPDITVATGDDGVAVLTIDVPGQRMNILRESFFNAAHAALDEVIKSNAVKAAVIISGKPDSFIAGADISIIQSLETAEHAAEVCRWGHSIMDKIANSNKPFVAAIHGVALGGGLELALACHARVLSDDSKTMVGLPEVQLGVLPGFGGSQRLPRLIGVAPALDLMLTGRHVKAIKAKRLGLADEVVPASILLSVAVKKALQLVAKPTVEKSKLSDFLSLKKLQTLALEKNPIGKKLLFQQARKKLYAKTHGNYPAPDKIIEVVEYGIDQPLADAFNNEIQGFAELAVTPQAKQLMNVYFAQTAVKKQTFIKSDIEAKTISKVGVLGGGLMGAGIATVSIDRAGVDVRIKDVADKGIRSAIQHVSKFLKKKVARRSIKAADAARTLSRLTGTLSYSGLSKADLIIEAVFEDLKLKKQIVKDIEELTDDKTIFATNTSSIPIKDIARGAKRPQNIIGMHYFSPVEKMPLLEIITHNRTSDETIAACVKFGKRQGKTVIVVKDVAGFYVNRILFPYINEAGHLAMEGVAIDEIDKALTKWGLPVGPFKLLDEVGLDVGAKVQVILEKAYGQRMQSTDMVDRMIATGRLGRKANKGFYSYDKKSKGKLVDEATYQVLNIRPEKHLDQQQIVDRCILPLLNEAALCLEEGVISSTIDGDIGTIFGIGFPPFLGGPFRYMDSVGADLIVKKLKLYEQQYGERFAPAESLIKMAESKKKYY